MVSKQQVHNCMRSFMIKLTANYASAGLCAFGDVRNEKGIKELLIQTDPSVHLEDIVLGLSHVQYLDSLHVTGSSIRPQCLQRLCQWEPFQRITCFGICPGLENLKSQHMIKLADCHSLESLSIDRYQSKP